MQDQPRSPEEYQMQFDRFFAVFLTLFLVCSLPSSSQTLDTGILGTVSDPQGASIAGAEVTISNPATGVSRSVKTGPDGKYEVRYLVPGDYTVAAQAAGFRTERR